MHLTHLFSREKITAAILIPVGETRDCLLVGYGSRIKAFIIENEAYPYRNKSYPPYVCLEVLPNRTIHKFTQGKNSLIIVHGQKSISVIRAVSIESLGIEIVVPSVEYDDWILDAVWFSDGIRFAFITAHNRVHVVNANNGQIQHTYCSALNCILSDLVIESASDIAVAAGTVFNKVVIWRCNEGDKAGITAELFHHKGVIFDVNINYSKKLLSTVSDDRTICLWTWENQADEENNSLCNNTFSLYRVLIGHTARVWRSAVLDDAVISVAEDAHIIVWNYDGSVRRSVRAHKGKSIWSMAYNDRYLMTGGGDTAVKIWDLPQLIKQNASETNPLQIRYQMDTQREDDFPRSVSIGQVGCYQLTDQGYLTAVLLKQDKLNTMIVAHEEEWTGYTVLSGVFVCCDKTELVALGNSVGNLFVVKLAEGKLISKSKFEVRSGSKVMSAHWLNQDRKENEVYLLCTCEDGSMFVYELKDDDLHRLYELHLPMSKQRFLIAACLFDSIRHGMIICADKYGSLYTYDMQSDSKHQPIQTLHRIHGKNGITGVEVHDNSIYTTGRDGYYKKFSIRSTKHLTLDNEYRVTRQMDWISRLIFHKRSDSESASDVIVAGFMTTQFVLYSLSLSQILLRIECGGGHRNWDLLFEDQQLWFTFVKDKKTHIVIQRLPEICFPLQDGLHGAKVTWAAWLPWKHKQLITCSDDTTVQLNKLLIQGKQSNISHQTSVATHISSVRCGHITPSLCDQNTCIILTGGGRAELVASSVQNNGQVRHLSTIYLTERSTLTKKQLKSHMPDPETRIMSIDTTVLSYNPTHHLICVACSDGLTRVVVLEEPDKKMVVSDLVYKHTHCLLSLKVYKTSDTTLLLVGGTDGLVLVFDITGLLNNCISNQELNPCFSLRCHQSGVNALECFMWAAGCLTLYTGGDDCSVCVSTIDTTCWKLIDETKHARLHSAQVTGIALVNSNSFISASIDQRLILWNKYDSEWQVAQVYFTTVPDVSGICLHCDGELVAVHGEGMEILELAPDTVEKENRYDLE